MTITKHGKEIVSLRDWEVRAGPKSRDQWVDGRSAKETARLWLCAGSGQLPAEIQQLLSAHPSFGPVTNWEAEPEARLHFDKFPGEPRNSDLAVLVEDVQGTALVAVEAKADEPFGDLVRDTLSRALERKLASNASNGLLRVEQLAQSLFGARQNGEPHIKAIRYQLLTASAGAISEAARRGCGRALLLIQEFVTSETIDDKHRANAADLNLFIQRISHGAVTSLEAGEIVGPFPVAGTPLFEPGANTYVGKVVHNIRA